LPFAISQKTAKKPNYWPVNRIGEKKRPKRYTVSMKLWPFLNGAKPHAAMTKGRKNRKNRRNKTMR